MIIYTKATAVHNNSQLPAMARSTRPHTSSESNTTINQEETVLLLMTGMSPFPPNDEGFDVSPHISIWDRRQEHYI